MADRMAAHIEIGGKLARSKLNELLSLIDDLSAEDYWSSPPNQEYLQKCTDDKKPMVLYDEQARYGEFEELEQFCIENDLTFKRQSSPKYEYEGQIRFFLPASGEHVISATDDGEPYLKLSELKDYQDKGLTLQEVIEKVEEYDGDVPSFELIEQPPVLNNVQPED
jgi:hypothetical protein